MEPEKHKHSVCVSNSHPRKRNVSHTQRFFKICLVVWLSLVLNRRLSRFRNLRVSFSEPWSNFGWSDGFFWEALLKTAQLGRHIWKHLSLLNNSAEALVNKATMCAEVVSALDGTLARPPTVWCVLRVNGRSCRKLPVPSWLQKKVCFFYSRERHVLI